ncbi:MAG: helix-turn-helix transcriptional regulator [Bacillota bacterium]
MPEDKAKSLERRFQLLTILMGGGRPKAGELARRFGVTLRTIYRDVNFLEQQQIPIVREGGRYAVLESFKVRPIQFRPDEVMALMTALDFAQRSRSLGARAAKSAREKLLAGLPSREKELAAGLDETLVVDPIQGHSDPAGPEVEARLQAALQGPHPVRIRYQALAAEEPTERVVRPYGQAYRGTGLYLIGYCELRQEIRTFRVNRILSAEVLPQTFTRPADFDLERFLNDIWGIEDGPEMQVVIRFDRPVARLAKETLWHPSQQTEMQEDGTAIVRMTTRGRGEIARWLAGYGGQAEVLHPPELREAVLALGRGIVARYGG